MSTIYRSNLGRTILAAAFGILGATAAQASTITAPIPLTSPDSVYTFSGVGFTPTVAATLTDFTFENQGLADTVELVDSAGDVLDSVSTPAATPSDSVSGLTWALTAGTQYYLLQTTASNSMYTGGPFVPPSDSEITMTSTGVFSSSPASSAFTINGDVFWAAFSSIGTTPSGVPEPGTWGLLLPGLAAMWWGSRRKSVRSKA
jgi:hypothetical protein